MRVLQLIGFAIALLSWTGAMGLPVAGAPRGQPVKVAHPGVLYSFGSASDGLYPQSGVAYANGVLYVTTVSGGKYGGGTVFAITPAGSERVLHDFGNGADGAEPWASLIEVNGVLYGTTVAGGANHKGTVFAMTPAGSERVLHNFGNGTDGANPWSGLIDVNGILYGTTGGGGTGNQGTVFAMTPAGLERVLFNFRADGQDGDGWPSSLIDVDGLLYGTTWAGGRYDDGTVFSVTPTGTERVVHSFGSGSDGRNPYLASLTDVAGVLYGTTGYGGRHVLGTIFAVTPAGTERVLHNFGNGTDGYEPSATLLSLNGVLYGTTLAGGRYGSGTVFAITTAGYESVLRNFGFCDGPIGGALVDVNGVLYGTTQYGGQYHKGTIFFESP